MSDAQKQKFLESETEFGLSLLRQLPLDDCLVFSPLSISLALSLVHSGANGQTKQQITQAICKGASDDEAIEHYKALSAAFLSASNGVQVNIANKMFIRDGFHIQEKYLESIAKNFQASAENLDFDNGDKSANHINQFISDATKGKITKMLTAEQFTPLTVAFLINALYFKADWADKFYSASTKKMPFYASKNAQREIDFLNASSVNRSYTETDEVQVLSLKYSDPSYAFTIFLPKEKFGLAKFRDGLTASKLQGLLGNLRSTLVSISIPKMKIEKELKLVPMLRSLGINDVFGDNADLRGIADQIFVSDATHKAIIEIDEEGTVAAAVTVISCEMRGMRIELPPKPFTADHPFFYTITHNRHIIFIGAFAKTDSKKKNGYLADFYARYVKRIPTIEHN